MKNLKMQLYHELFFYGFYHEAEISECRSKHASTMKRTFFAGETNSSQLEASVLAVQKVELLNTMVNSPLIRPYLLGGG